MATFTFAESGNWKDGATWGNTSPGVEGLDYPGSGDVGYMNASSGVLTVDSEFNSAFEIRRGTLNFSDGVTVNYAGDCLIGTTTYGYQCTVTFGAGCTINQDIYDTTVAQATVLFNGNILNPVTVTGSGSWLHNGYTTGEQRRRYNLQYYRFLLTGDVQLTTGKGDTSPSVTEFVLDYGVFVGYNSLDMWQWSSTWDVSITNIHCVGDGTISFGRRSETPTGDNVYQNVYVEANTNATLTFVDYGLGSGGKFENLHLKNVKVGQFGANDLWDFQGLFQYVDSFDGTYLSCINNDNLDAKDFYFECDSGRTNPHILDVKSGSLDRAFFNVDYDTEFNDDGDLVSPRNGSTFTLSRAVSMKSSGLLALTTVPTGTFVMDHCTLNTTKAGIDCLLKIENSVAPFSGNVTVKNSLHVGGDSDATVVQRAGDTTYSVDIDSINNCSTSNVDILIESGKNVTATSTASNLFDVDPGFVDSTRDLTSYGGVDYMMTADGFDSDANWFGAESGASISELLTYLEAGFTPTNTSLQYVADDGGDIGAVPVGSGPTPPEPSGRVVKLPISGIAFNKNQASKSGVTKWQLS